MSVDGVICKGMTAEEVGPLIRFPEPLTHPPLPRALRRPPTPRVLLRRGPVGSVVEIEVLRPGETKTTTVRVVRQKIINAGPAPPQQSHQKGIRESIQAGAEKLKDAFAKTQLGQHIAARQQAAVQEQEEVGDGGGEMEISAPFNFEHNYHTTVDPNSATGFRGLPPGWDELLKQAKITKEEAMENGDAIIDILR